MFAVVALMSVTSCEKNLDIEQKGVTAYENFYQTDADAEAALTAAYARFATYVTGRGNEFIYTPYKGALNMGGDDMYGAGSNYGDNDFLPQLDEFRYDSGNQVITNLYKGLFLANYACNLVIDNFKDGLPNGGPTATTKRCVAEAKVMRAYIYFLLATLWDNPPFIDHVITDDLPYNCDKDPVNPMSHKDLLIWVATQCEEAVTDLTERQNPQDKDGAVKVTKGFAYAVAGKAYIFAEEWDKAKTCLEAVIKSDKYELVPGDKFWQNFHIEGDANEEKIFESNIEYNSGIDAWGGINQRSTWMESQIWSWRSDHFVTGANPSAAYTGGVDGWGGMGVPLWFAEAFKKNDGVDSYRFNVSLKHIDDVVYKMEYLSDDLNKMTLDEKKSSALIGIQDVKDGLYGQSFYLPYKQIMRATDAAGYDANVRLNNNIVMRYAEVLLLYAEACVMDNKDLDKGLQALNDVQIRANSAHISKELTLDEVKNEKMFELYQEGCRWLDLLRWGDTSRVKDAGKNVPKLYDKIHRDPNKEDFKKIDAGKELIWENGTEANSRFYMVSSHEAIDAGATVGYQEKHRYFPFPMDVIEKNPNIVQRSGF